MPRTGYPVNYTKKKETALSDFSANPKQKWKSETLNERINKWKKETPGWFKPDSEPRPKIKQIKLKQVKYLI